MKYSRSTCAAFTWNGDGVCHGVQLEVRSSGCRVVTHWKGESSAVKSAAIAETLADAKKTMGIADGVVCLAGSSNGGWGMADVKMPSLKPEELRSALAFELRKQTPIPAERLTWGFRMLSSGKSEDGKQAIRLFYAKTEVWRKWTEAATGLGHLDMVLPPPVGLDPMLEGQTVTFPGKSSFAYVPSANGRDVVPATQQPGRIAECFPLEGLDLGALAALSSEEQLEYLPALVLAAYGLTREFTQDLETMPALPADLRPRRYQTAKFLAVLFGVMIVAFLGIGLLQGTQRRMVRLRQIKADIRKVESQISGLSMQNLPKSKEAAKALEAEMAKYQFETPEISDVLVALTKEIKSPAWMAGSFEWTNDNSSNVVPLSFVIREPVGDIANLDLANRLNASPILGDVTETKTSQNRNGYTERRFILKAREDTAEEKIALEEAQKAAAEKAAQAKAAAEKAAQEEDTEEDGEAPANGQQNPPQALQNNLQQE